MDCFPDYCLACDKQIVEGLYCSQACRLTDLERAGSGPTSPNKTLPYPSASSLSSSAYHGNVGGFQLPPALDFYAYTPPAAPRRSASSVSLDAASRYQVHIPHHHPHQTSSAPETPARLLTPSSSRSSLSSGISGIHSRNPSDGLSAEAKNELKSYFDSFDHTRERRRRSYPVSDQGYYNMASVRGFADEQD